MARARLLGVSALPHLPGGSSAAAIAAIATVLTTTVATAVATTLPTTPRAAAATIAAGEPARPGSSRLTCRFVLAGEPSTFDVTAFRAALQARFSSATSIDVAVTAASVVADVVMLFGSEASASEVKDAFESTDAATMAEEWFDGTVTILNEPSATVVVVVISERGGSDNHDCIGLVRRHRRSSRRCVVHCAARTQEKARGG